LLALPLRKSERILSCDCDSSENSSDESWSTLAKLCACVAVLLIAGTLARVHAQAPLLSEMYSHIRAEETNNSKINVDLHEVADVWTTRDGHAELEGGG